MRNWHLTIIKNPSSKALHQRQSIKKHLSQHAQSKLFHQSVVGTQAREEFDHPSHCQSHMVSFNSISLKQLCHQCKCNCRTDMHTALYMHNRRCCRQMRETVMVAISSMTSLNKLIVSLFIHSAAFSILLLPRVLHQLVVSR